MISSD